jgi:hypothetical protein
MLDRIQRSHLGSSLFTFPEVERANFNVGSTFHFRAHGAAVKQAGTGLIGIVDRLRRKKMRSAFLTVSLPTMCSEIHAVLRPVEV